MLNAEIGLTAVVAIFFYAVNVKLSRGYLIIALPSTTVFNLVAQIHDQEAPCTNCVRVAGACQA